jgi:hypothetical protein
MNTRFLWDTVTKLICVNLLTFELTIGKFLACETYRNFARVSRFTLSNTWTIIEGKAVFTL